MATVPRFTNTASAGGDGTTNGTAGATAAYASMSSWEANAGGSATDDYINDCCGSSADSTSVIIDFAVNITTGSVLVRGNRSDPAGFYTGPQVISTSHYRMDPGNVANVLSLVEPNCTVDGIQAISGHTTASGSCLRHNTTGAFTWRKNRVFNSASCDYGIGSNGGTFGGATTRTIENNLVVGFDHTQIAIQLSNFAVPTIHIYHNTCFGDGVCNGILTNIGSSSGAAVINVMGNALAGCGGNELTATITSGTLNYADNACDQTNLTTDEIIIGNIVDAWTSPSNSDTAIFTVKDASSPLYQSVNPTLVSDDIADNTRPGSTHDAGCFALVSLSGTLARTTENATLAASGGVLVSGSLARTLDEATLSAAGGVLIAGTLARTLDDATLAATGGPIIAGALARTLDEATLAAAGGVLISGTLVQTLEDATLAAAGGVLVSGTLDSTLDDTTLTGAGIVSSSIDGSLARTLDDATTAASGGVLIAGSLTSALDDATLSAAGGVLVAGGLARALEESTLAAVGEISGGALDGTLAAILADATLSAAGVVLGTITGTLNRELADATLAAVGSNGEITDLVDWTLRDAATHHWTLSDSSI